MIILFCHSAPLNYRWFRDGKEMPRNATFSESRRVMTITGVQIEDGGQYRCRVDGRKTSQFDEKNFTLIVQCVYDIKECLCVCVHLCVCLCVCLCVYAKPVSSVRRITLWLCNVCMTLRSVFVCTCVCAFVSVFVSVCVSMQSQSVQWEELHSGCAMCVWH